MNNMKQIMNEWRKFTKSNLLNERTAPNQFYPTDYQTAEENIVQKFKDHTWIFFDTETTGLKEKEPHVQITQLAAIGYNTNAFETKPEEVEGARFNMKIELQPATVERKEQEDSGEIPSDDYSISNLLAMTRYYEEPFQPESPAAVAQAFTDFIMNVKEKSPSGSIVLIAHNADFDVKMLNELYRRAGITPPGATAIDSLAFTDIYFKPVLEYIMSNKLDDKEDKRLADAITLMNRKGNPYYASKLGNLVTGFEIENKGWHEATADIAMTMDVLHSVIDYMRRKGVKYPDAQPGPMTYKFRRGGAGPFQM